MIAQHAHDEHHDKRVTHENERGKRHSRPPEGRHIIKQELGAEHHEEDDEEKVAQGPDARLHFALEQGARERHPGDERPELEAEPEPCEQAGYEKAPRDREDEQELLGPGCVRHQPRHDSRGNKPKDRHEDEPFAERLPQDDIEVALGSERGKAEQDKERDEILHEEEPDAYPTVERVEVLLVDEELHDDDRARERKRDRKVHARDRIKPEGAGDKKTDKRGEQHLPDAGRHRNAPDLPHGPPIEPKPYCEQQESHAELAHRREHVKVAGEGKQLRAHNDTGQNIGDDERLVQALCHERKNRRNDDNDRDLKKKFLQKHGFIITSDSFSSEA
ncbi:MAG: hypothetical protein UY77_C0034G0013 [Candidatus Uhrbacteria bacterium GW2011_GWA2_53_10]|uniref:Uncharacterized protein n=1 Tax=Candidatus Uhrbacteria bacterium GW2011_GWA2_53_10 TaxID=1618980 RepID=A0A0G1XLK6_9BACT|nr:MAG: hypothetical protein UY77_C0034G0013 [Candidatus Uhrbacteria bacterium GW2011_GWA2_53_10]